MHYTKNLGVVLSLLLFSKVTVGTASEPCKFTECRLNAVQLLAGCGSGYSSKGYKDCGAFAIGPITGTYYYASREIMCCENGSSCSWYDVSCNWGTLKDYFQQADDKIKAAWSALSSTLQDKLTIAEKFETLTDLELSGLDLGLIAELKSIAGMTARQLGVISGKVHDMSKEQLSDFLQNVNPHAMKDGIVALGSGAASWTASQVSSISTKLKSSEVWGAASSWKSDQIDSLESMITVMETTLIDEFANPALAGAKVIVNFSARQLSSLGNKIGSMDSNDFKSTVKGVSSRWTHAAMMEQCEIRCESDSDMEFMRDPSVANAAEALVDYAERVGQKSALAALAYANAFCRGDPTNTTEATALLDSAAVPCSGSARKNTSVAAFDKWARSQQQVLVTALVEADALGDLVDWTDTQMSSLCHQYGSFPPSRIGEIAASALISHVEAKINPKHMAMKAVFGPWPWPDVASFAIGQAAELIFPGERAAWTRKLKDGLGVASKWGCVQMASLRTLAAGLDASDLSELSESAIKGILPKAITAMDASQVKGFTPDGFVAMTAQARKRVNGNRLSMLDERQKIAAVCGIAAASLEWLREQPGCPVVVVDLTMDFPAGNTPTTDQLVGHFQPVTGTEQVEVLSVLGDSDRPLMSTPAPAPAPAPSPSSSSCSLDTGGSCASGVCYSWRKATCTNKKCVCASGTCASSGSCVAGAAGGRRLGAGSTEVTVRIHSSSNSNIIVRTTIDVQAAATSLTLERGGSVVGPAVYYNVVGPHHSAAVVSSTCAPQIGLSLIALGVSSAC